jgi:glycopeptide antibiotics resistance protein
MFGTQHEYFLILQKYFNNSNSSYLKSMKSSKKNILATSLSACLAGLTEATLTPFERVQAVLQMQKFHDSYRHTLHVFQDISKKYGYKELYRGISAICVRNAMSNAIFFTTRQPLKAVFPETKSKLKNSLYDFLSGGILGAFISTLFYPLNVIKSHMQAKVGGEFLSIYQTFRIVFESRDRKINMLFKGNIQPK